MRITDSKLPELRFPTFSEEWREKRINEIITRYVNPVDVEENKEYKEIGIRSHGKGIFHKEKIKGKDLGNKRVFWVKENAFIVNIVFAWEQAVAKTSIDEIGFIASHRFPMYFPKNDESSVDYLLHFFLTNKGKKILELASPGGAGRNKTLGQEEFGKSKIILPLLPEQKKIATFLSSVDERYRLLKEKKEKLVEYKKGVMQLIFSKELRFTKSDGSAYPDWEEKILRELLYEHKTRNIDLDTLEVFSVAKEKGVVNQIEHLGRSYAAEDTSGYKVVYPYDIIYTKSPTSGFPFGIIKQNKTDRSGIVSTLYGVFKPTNKHIGNYLDAYFSSEVRTYNYLVPLVQKGAKNTMNISNETFLDGAKIFIPTSEEEQRQIAFFLSSIDRKIAIYSEKISQHELYKKGLIQKMFV